MTRKAWGKVGLDPFDARPFVEERKKEESEAVAKKLVRMKRSPLAHLSNSPDGYKIWDHNDVLSPETSPSSDKENIPVDLVRTLLKRARQDAVNDFRAGCVAEGMNSSMVRKVYNKVNGQELDESKYLGVANKRSRMTAGSDVFKNYNGDATKPAFIAAQLEKERMKDAAREQKEARKARLQDKKSEKLCEYKELKGKILKASAKKKIQLDNKLLNLLWFGLLAENPESKQSMKASEKKKNPLNRAVLQTQDILDLIEKYDDSFFTRITAVCSWRIRRSND